MIPYPDLRSVTNLLRWVNHGRFQVGGSAVRHRSLDDLVSAVTNLGVEPLDVVADGQARPDVRRDDRTGAPEVIFASGKEFAQIQALVDVFLERKGRAIVSRLADQPALALLDAYRSTHHVRHSSRAQLLVVRDRTYQAPPGGRVGVITAGTSDLPVAEQAQILAEEMGCSVTLISDVGVAGIHRLFGPLRQMLDDDVDAIVVAAGMDGALPSVVSGLVDVPVIGVPTSTGYGIGGRGLAALLSMLQTCAPGLSVVNVDNGVGAGITAALIANRVARARQT
jgi:NCAIR mutase (PurE)-related protein